MKIYLNAGKITEFTDSKKIYVINLILGYTVLYSLMSILT